MRLILFALVVSSVREVHHVLCSLIFYAEIVDFCEFVSPTEEEHAERCAAVERISSAVKCVWPNCQVRPFSLLISRGHCFSL